MKGATMKMTKAEAARFYWVGKVTLTGPSHVTLRGSTYAEWRVMDRNFGCGASTALERKLWIRLFGRKGRP